jgi:hypothetical protein
MSPHGIYYMGKKYKCSYCLEKGHNVRGCASYKNDIILAASRTLELRKELVVACERQGFGVGCIVSVNMRLWDNSLHEYINVDTIGTVEEIFWKHLFWKNLSGDRGVNGAVKISFTHPIADARVYVTTALPPSIQKEMRINSTFAKRSILKIVGKSDHLSLPEFFLDFEHIKKEVERRHRFNVE